MSGVPGRPPFPASHVPRSAGEEIAVLAALLARPWAADLCPPAWFKSGPSRWLRDWLAAPGRALQLLDALEAEGVEVPGDADADPAAVARVVGAALQAELDALPGGEGHRAQRDTTRRHGLYDMRWLVHAVHGAATVLPELRRDGLGTLALLETHGRPAVRPRRASKPDGFAGWLASGAPSTEVRDYAA